MRLFVILILLTASFASLGQVRDVKERASSYKSSDSYSSDSHSGSSSSYDNSYYDSSFLADIFLQIAFGAVKEMHNYQLENNRGETWNNALEVYGFGGLNFNSINESNSQYIRGNWGLFSTQLRRTSTTDVTGQFNTIDWQIVQFNVINSRIVRWLLGIGFSYEQDIDQSHLEFATELYIRLFQERLIPQFSYRNSDDGFPRKEFNAMLEYRPFKDNKFEFSFLSGYEYRKLYDIPFHFISGGVKFAIK